MPYLKQIAAHTNCQAIQGYLEHDGRALAKDFFNLSVDERDGYGDEGKDIRWADEMDAMRHAFGNDTPFGNMRARTYKHFVVSPDPEDDIDLPALRELACAWTLKHFDGYQVAIVYHNDNEAHIPHAHVVVNNTNLETGLRMHHDDPKEFNRSLQEMARERKLNFLTEEAEPTEGLERLAAKERPKRQRPKTMQQVHLGRAERELADVGAYSWVADIRNRVSVAKSLARSEGEFRQVLDMLGVEVADNARNARRDDWIYSLADAPTKRVSGERLGLLFAKETIQREFKRAATFRPDAKTSRELMRIARDAVMVNDLGDLYDLSQALRICAYHSVSSIQDCDRKLEALQRRASSAEGRQKLSLDRSVNELESARDYMASRNLLPESVAKPHPRRTNEERGEHQRRPWTERQSTEERSRQTERQRDEAEERDER